MDYKLFFYVVGCLCAGVETKEDGSLFFSLGWWGNVSMRIALSKGSLLRNVFFFAN